MKYRSLNEIRKMGAVYGDGEPKMSRRERLERWAELLEQHPGSVGVLHETEYQPRFVRDALRADESPLTVAFRDPVLRFQGLKGDTYGDAVRFFDLSDSEAHHILCYCHYCARAVSAKQVATRVRDLAGRTGSANLLQLLGWMAGAGAGVVAVSAMVLSL